LESVYADIRVRVKFLREQIRNGRDGGYRRYGDKDRHYRELAVAVIT
jgi:hypothetical protein